MPLNGHWGSMTDAKIDRGPSGPRYFFVSKRRKTVPKTVPKGDLKYL